MSFRTLSLLLLAWTTIGVAQARAQDIDTRPRSGFVISMSSPPAVAGSEAIGQVFTVPAGQNSINSLGFDIDVILAPRFDVRVHRWDGGTNTVVGAALFQSGVLTAAGQAATVATPGLAVVPGDQYLVVITTFPSGPLDDGQINVGAHLASNYPGGIAVVQLDGDTSLTGAWTTTTSDLAFAVDFDAAVIAPPPAAVPTLSEWAAILLGLMLAALGLEAIRRRAQFNP